MYKKYIFIILLQNLLKTILGFTGDATAYADKLVNSNAGLGYNCGFNYINEYSQKYYLAMNSKQYDSGLACGRCINVNYQNRNIIGYVVDSCGSCEYGDIDLSIPMYTDLIQEPIGRTKVSWEWVSCNTIIDGTIKLVLQSGSSIWWLGLQVNNAIAETKNITINNNKLIPSTYNYWHLDSNTKLTLPLEIILISIDSSIVKMTINDFNSNLIETYQQYTIKC